VIAGQAARWSATCHIGGARRVNLAPMDENLAAQFEANRQRLQSMTCCMLGSFAEAGDAVPQEVVPVVVDFEVAVPRSVPA
jgi:hypothetical protein